MDMGSEQHQSGQNRHLRRQFFAFPWATEQNRKEWVFRPLISVVLPVFNQATLLLSSVSSVLQEVEHSLELVIVNDGSTDGVEEALEQLSDDPRVRIIHQKNRGIASALNTGFEEVRGSFVSWTSADNRYLPGALDALARFLLANPSVGLVYANVELIDHEGKPLRGSNYRPQDQAGQGSSEIYLPLAGDTLVESHDNFINACFLYRRSVRDLVGEYAASLYGCEDFDYWLRTSICTRLAHIDTERIYYHYRLHENSITAQLEQGDLTEKTKKLAYSAKRRKQLRHTFWRCTVHQHPEFDRHIISYLNSVVEPHLTFESDTGETRSSLRLELQIPDKTGGNDSLAAYCFRPRALPEKPQYMHSTHLQLHPTSALTSFVITKRGGKNSSPPRLISGAPLFPPIIAPQLIRRARDSFYSAVTLDSGSQSSILVFAPDAYSPSQTRERGVRQEENYHWTIETLASIIASLPQFTFVLLAANPSQRQSADIVHVQVGKTTNLRIIDLSASAQRGSTSASADSALSASLMYVLSSVDGILSVKSPQFGFSSLLEIRCEATLAALAGIGLLAVAETPLPTGRLCVADWFDPDVEEAELFAGLLPWLLPMPHLGVAQLPGKKEPDREQGMASLRDKLAAISSGIDLCSAEQWLNTVSVQESRQRLLNVLLA